MTYSKYTDDMPRQAKSPTLNEVLAALGCRSVWRPGSHARSIWAMDSNGDPVAPVYLRDVTTRDVWSVLRGKVQPDQGRVDTFDIPKT